LILAQNKKTTQESNGFFVLALIEATSFAAGVRQERYSE
jgi:hypothetical protein